MGDAVIYPPAPMQDSVAEVSWSGVDRRKPLIQRSQACAIQPCIFATVNLAEQVPLRFATSLVGCSCAEIRVGQPLRVMFRELAPGWPQSLFEVVEQ